MVIYSVSKLKFSENSISKTLYKKNLSLFGKIINVYIPYWKFKNLTFYQVYTSSHVSYYIRYRK